VDAATGVFIDNLPGGSFIVAVCSLFIRPARLVRSAILEKASDPSILIFDHLRWDLRAIFRLAVQDRVTPVNPAELLFTPRMVNKPSRRVLSAEQVQTMLSVLDLREQLIVRLALFSGMRPDRPCAS